MCFYVLCVFNTSVKIQKYTFEDQKLRNQSARERFGIYLMSTSGSNIISRWRSGCARTLCTFDAYIRVCLLAFHIQDSIRTITMKTRGCQHVCQCHERNPSTCEIRRATLTETLYGFARQRERVYAASPIKSVNADYTVT